MKDLVRSVINISVTIINIFLAYYTIGIILKVWDLDYILDFYNLKMYFAFIFILAVFRSQTTAKVAILQNKTDLKSDKKDNNKKLRESLVVTASILIILSTSCIIEFIFF